MTSNGLPWAAIVFGWPAVVVSIAAVIVGVALGRWRVVSVGSVLACPFLLYLFASPRVGWLSLIVGALYLACSLAVLRSKRGLALAMAMPFVVLACFVAWLVLSQ